MTKNEEKAETLNALFALVFNGWSPGTQPPNLKDRDREKNKAHIIQVSCYAT